MDEPKCLVIYKVGEYTGALWVVNGIYVHGCFRAHGHGEFDLNARRVGEDRWTCLEEGLNYDFGRVCDVFVQQLLRLPETEESVQLLRDIGLGWGERYVSGGGFVNFLMEVWFESQDVGGSDFFRVVCEDSVFEGVVGEVRVEWNRLCEFSEGE
jgi:hypothetical protein